MQCFEAAIEDGTNTVYMQVGAGLSMDEESTRSVKTDQLALLDIIQKDNHVNASTRHLMASLNWSTTISSHRASKRSQSSGACLLRLEKRMPGQFACRFSCTWMPEKHSLGEIQKRFPLLSHKERNRVPEFPVRDQVFVKKAT